MPDEQQVGARLCAFQLLAQQAQEPAVRIQEGHAFCRQQGVVNAVELLHRCRHLLAGRQLYQAAPPPAAAAVAQGQRRDFSH